MGKLAVIALVFLASGAWAQKNSFPQVDAGSDFACALVNGQLWCWGANPYIWPDKADGFYGPRRIGPDKVWKAMACTGEDVMALDEKGVAWGWGYGSWLHNKDDDDSIARKYNRRIYPIDIFHGMTLGKIDISSYHFAGIALDGTLWLAGRDDCGVFFNANDNLSRPVQKAGTWTEVAMGNMHGVVMDADHAIRQDGSLWFWGTHNYDIGDPEFTVVPTRIGGDAIWIAVSTHEIHTLAVREDGSLWARGGNSHGQLGDGTKAPRMDLTRIGKDTDWVTVKAGLYMSLAVKKNGTVWAWGDN